MIKLLDSLKILDEINRLLLAGIPELDRIYIDIVPQNFVRPAALIELVTTLRENMCAKIVRKTDFFTITLYDRVGDRYESSSLRLMELVERVIDLFREGYIRVEDRAPEVTAQNGGRDFDRAFVEVQITYTEQRLPDSGPQTLMRNVTLKLKEGN